MGVQPMKRSTVVRALVGCLAIAMLLGAATLPVRSDSSHAGVAGRVFHIVTGEPVPGAVISVSDSLSYSDEQGWYALPLPAGRYTVEARAAGYLSMSETLVRVSENLTEVNFAMLPAKADDEMQAMVESRLQLYEQTIPVEVEIAAQSGEMLSSGVTEVPATIRLLVREDPAIIDSPPVEVITLDFEEYLKGVVPYEMSPTWPEEALKAQAVAARSYAAANLNKHASENADVCSSVHCQVWRPTHYATTDAAVEATRGVAATYTGSIIYAFFHGHCDGHTRNSEDVWSAALPYCRSVPCSCGSTSLYGHGVGMCQVGARAMANAGATYSDIIRHYYTGVSLLGEPSSEISEAAVQPSSGSVSTEFAFSARLVGSPAVPPAVANVIIDGHAHAMVRQSGDPSSGWLYVYTSRLSAGAHSYRFEFDDGFARVSAWPASGTMAGPQVTPESPEPDPVPMLEGSISASTAQDWAGGVMDGIQSVTADKDVLALASGRSSGTYTSPILRAGSPFVAYGALWYTDLPLPALVTMETRASQDGVSWSPWHTEAGEDYVPGNRRLQSAALVFGEAQYLQYRVTLRTGQDGLAPSVRNIRLSFIDSRSGPSASAMVPEPTALSVPPTVISRAAWGANESWMTWAPEYRTIRAMIMHHTVTDDGGVDPAAIVRAIYWYHAVERGWGDIGYNYLVDHDGRIYEGRYGGPGVVGHHAGDPYNYGSVGISLIGNFEENPVPPDMYEGVLSLLAYQCSTHSVNPVGETYLIDRTVPTILGHRDVAATACPGAYAYALLPAIRVETLARMYPDPPQLLWAEPVSGQVVRGVVTPVFTTQGSITRMSYYVDGALSARRSEEFVWKWNSTLYADGPHTLRVVVENGGGSDEVSVSLTVDNTAPLTAVSAPLWTAASEFAVTLSGGDASAVAFSPGWAWEGESLYHQTGVYAADPSASQGGAWLGRGGVDGGGAWYGPYTCVLPQGEYQVVYSLRTDAPGAATGLATLDVTDEGHVKYALQPVAASDFVGTDYQDFVLPLAYSSVAASCQAGTGGIEFRTWYSGQGNLWLDRVRVFTASVARSSAHIWPAPASEGLLHLTVRLLDEVGNAVDHELTVGIDRTGPAWSAPYGSAYWVIDPLAGQDPSQAAYRVSHNGGSSWGDWESLAISASSGTTGYVLYDAGLAPGALVQYRAVDRAGNMCSSPPVETGIEPPPLNQRVYLPAVLR